MSYFKWPVYQSQRRYFADGKKGGNLPLSMLHIQMHTSTHTHTQHTPLESKKQWSFIFIRVQLYFSGFTFNAVLAFTEKTKKPFTSVEVIPDSDVNFFMPG